MSSEPELSSESSSEPSSESSSEPSSESSVPLEMSLSIPTLTRVPKLFGTYHVVLIGNMPPDLRTPFSFFTPKGDITVHLWELDDKRLPFIHLIVISKELRETSSGSESETASESSRIIAFWYKKNGEYLKKIEDLLEEEISKKYLQ